MRPLVVLLFLAPILAGCFTAEEAEPPAPPAPVAPASWDGRLVMDVPIDVVLIGLDLADEVAAGLTPLSVDQDVYNNARLLNPTGGAISPTRPAPMDLTARYNVIDAGAFVAAQVRAAVEASEVDGLIDAVAVDDAIAAALANANITFDEGRPGMVILHLGSQGHSYRLQYVTGHIDDVRVFGERHGYLAMDISAAVDPWVGSGQSYNAPLAPDGAETVDAIVAAVHQATWFRLLQGPLYPQSTHACHAVTLLLAVRGTALSQVLPGYSSAEDLLDVPGLTTAWESLLGEGRVFVDANVLHLPADDPVLDGALRDNSNEALRAWADTMWDTYWVPHEGCQAYVSVFLFGDAGDRGVSGIAMYDVNDDRRISMSNMNDLDLMREQDGAAGPVLYVDDASRNETDWIDFLFSHETGHLFGQRHPHDTSGSETPGFEPTFSSIWSTMSYQQAGKIPLFGDVDTNNYWRNRAGFIIEEAAAQGLEADPAFAEALQLAGEYHWPEAGDALQPLLA